MNRSTHEDYTAKLRRLVRCGGCGGRIDRVNLMQLDLMATWDYPCAGNVITGEDHQAVALLCDACIDAHVQAKEAVEISGETVTCHPVSELKPVELTPEQARRKAALLKGHLLPFSQTDSWPGNNDPYSADHCCYCGNPVKAGAAMLRLCRTADGEYWLVPRGFEPPPGDDFGDGMFLLPIGPDCLRRHPEWHCAVELTREDPNAG